MNGSDACSWDDGLEGTPLRIAGLDHTPISVMAGPGTGKTFALMRRVARLLQQGVKPTKDFGLYIYKNSRTRFIRRIVLLRY